MDCYILFPLIVVYVPVNLTCVPSFVAMCLGDSSIPLILLRVGNINVGSNITPYQQAPHPQGGNEEKGT